MYTGIRLLLFIRPFISSLFFLSNFQTLKFSLHFSRLTKFILDTHSGQWMDVSCIPRSGCCCCCLFVPLFHFSSSLIFKHYNFCHPFLRNSEAYKAETWYTYGQWVDVLCILESGCCSYSSLYSFVFLSLRFLNIESFCRTFLKNC